MLFPVFMDLQKKPVLVIGGGIVAERKVELLLDTGATITIVSPKLTDKLNQWFKNQQFRYIADIYTEGLIKDYWLIIAATNDPVVNEQISAEAALCKIPCNVVDCPRLSSIQIPSIVNRTPLVVAVSSGGYAPVLARRLREQIEAIADENIGVLATMLADMRQSILVAYPNLERRRHFYEQVLDGPLLDMIRSGEHLEAQKSLESAIAHPAKLIKTGECILISTDPRRPELLTLQALRELNGADVVLSGSGIHPDILAKSRRDASKICIHDPKKEDVSCATQANEIIATIVRHIGLNQKVVVILPHNASHSNNPFMMAINELRKRSIKINETSEASFTTPA